MSELSDVYTRRAHFIEQFKNGEFKNFDPFLRRVIKSLREQLLLDPTELSRSRLEAKLGFIEVLVRDELSEFTTTLSSQLNLFATQEAAFTVAALTNATQIAASLPTSSQLKAAINARPFAGKILKNYLGDFSKEQANMIRNTISTAFFEGKGTREIVKQIVGSKKLKYKDGLLNVTRTSAERMVRTAVSHTSAVAKSYTLEQNKDIAPKYRWSSVLDGRTSTICGAGDGKVFFVGKGPIAPHHFNCRSTEIPLLAGEDGEEIIDYNDWLGKQSKDFQDKALGLTRAELFRDGMAMDKFVNNGQVLTLDQLETVYPEAWAKL